MIPLRYLYGGQDTPWDPSQWTSSDDRVRGGKSVSHMTCSEKNISFNGNLDIQTLGGAGFASQRTLDSQTWDLSLYSGLILNTASSDGKKYTVVLKDTNLPKRPDGREQSTVSWEYDFVADKSGGEVLMPFADFQPTYRGRAAPDAAPLNLAGIKRISFMMRSFFGNQEGDFSLCIKSLACADPNRAVGRVPSVVTLNDCATAGAQEPPLTEKGEVTRGTEEEHGPVPSRFRRWLCCA